MITRDDIEAKAHQIEEAVNDTGHFVRSAAMRNALAWAGALAVVFLAGRRRARRRGARVEIHRL